MRISSRVLKMLCVIVEQELMLFYSIQQRASSIVKNCWKYTARELEPLFDGIVLEDTEWRIQISNKWILKGYKI